MKSAIRVENLSKHYTLGSRANGLYRTLRETISDSFTSAWSGLRDRLGGTHNGKGSGGAMDNSFWALQDVSFDVQPGEVVGIIGRNGAGKSTLLKVLSRITEPSSGRCEIRGRMGSLLEVGTGFHPELTGRENIYMNGSILGMKRKEIERKFDEIVAFAEIEQFLDTPVKRYSSGMYVRLAFAVSAHLEPEIIVVDEVLAVGDVAFQKKCLQRMRDAGREGRTILFVSHNLAALRGLCRRGIVLEQGRLVKESFIDEAVNYFLSGIEAAATTDLAERTDRMGAGRVRLHKVEISSPRAGESGHLVMGQPARFDFHIEPALADVTCIFTVYNEIGLAVTRFNSALSSLEDSRRMLGEPTLVCEVDEMLLGPGRYRIDAALRIAGELQDRIEAAIFFDVAPSAVRGRESPPSNGWVCYLPHRWRA